MASAIEPLVRALVASTTDADGTDAELLNRFIDRRDDGAFAVLVRRHGPMVLGVCRRLLPNEADAEDVFQATFLVLALKAATVAPRQMVAAWLHGVARQVALRARRANARRAARERQLLALPEPESAPHDDRWDDLLPVLDRELDSLPHHYRVVLVLCDLEGVTRQEAARQLGLPVGTVNSRLSRARTMLTDRLTRCGVILPSGALATVLAQNAASATVPTSVASNTIRVACSFAAGPVSAQVTALTEGVLKAMLMSKLKAAVAVMLVLGLLLTGVTVLLGRTATAEWDNPPVAEERVTPPPKATGTGDFKVKAAEKEVFTAWGKEVDGVQAGLGYLPGAKRVYTLGESVTLVLRIRNVGKEAVEFRQIGAFYIENPPTIRDADGKRVPILKVAAEGRQLAYSITLAPGKEVELYNWSFDLRPQGEGNKGSFTIHGTGKFSLQCEHVVGPTLSNPKHPNPAMDKLGTGKLELEVKEAKKPVPEKEEKEAFTAWGKEINGLQAGLGFRPGEKRVYSHGEAVAVVLRVRNVGKEAVGFKHIWAFFVENLPTITDADGKVIQLRGFKALGLQQPRSTNVAPGKEVELYEWSFDLRPQGESGNKGSLTIHGSGKFSLQCERIVGPTSANPNHPNPAMSKLATGKLELEVKEPKKQPQEEEKEAFTAWGKEVDGVQAGLGYLPDAKRTYYTGETARLVVRVRNGGKKEVKFVYAWESFYEQPPVVTDDAGKPVPFTGVGFSGWLQFKEVTLAPGKETDLCELNVALQPASEKDKNRPWSLYETGKFQLQFTRVGGNIGTGEIKLDPILSKLVTGKLELEVKSDPPPGATEKK